MTISVFRKPLCVKSSPLYAVPQFSLPPCLTYPAALSTERQVVNKTFQPLKLCSKRCISKCPGWKPQPFEVPGSSPTLAGSKGKPPSTHGASIQHPLLPNSSCWASTHKLRDVKARWNCTAASNGMVFSNYLCKNSCFMCYFFHSLALPGSFSMCLHLI